jgi:hypothetical protein
VVQRGVEAHPGLDRDRQLVDEVRQLGVDALAAPRRGLTDEEVGDVDAGGAERDREQDAAGTVGERQARQEAERRQGDAPGHEHLGGETARDAGAPQLRVDLLGRVLPPQLFVDLREQLERPVEEGGGRAGAGRLRPAARRGANGLERRAAVALRRDPGSRQLIAAERQAGDAGEQDQDHR